jgi:hypothetical protein
MEIPGMANVNTRFKTSSIPIGVRRTLTCRWCSAIAAAPIKPKAAPDAPAVSASGSAISAPAEPHSSAAK